MSTGAETKAFMRAALALARRGLGETAPNPSVGCVIVQGWKGRRAVAGTAVGGRPHAQVEALAHGRRRGPGRDRLRHARAVQFYLEKQGLVLKN